MGAYRIPDKMKTEVDRQILEMLKEGKTRESISAFVHPIVLVTKPDQSIRICTDFRWIISGTVSDNYPMPKCDDLLREISDSNYISILDCSQGYYQLRMKPKSVIYTSFIAHRGQCEYLVMPFGLKCAGSTFQRVMGQMINNHQDYACAYIDDTSVWSSTWKDQLLHLRNVF